ncbi:hypothetical protein [Chryseobacterium viscerum]|uniref:Uncharacterized protein n=1 Tax=Chryseobacterium viscerum TaxID=1037377 RepID=A0A316WK15_9FLAO|nr:hypothetical protein [Chryseobacterium viscerum]PWN61509.1 hypothetical protein C1634_009450 [Chryseobacterium viscerum]
MVKSKINFESFLIIHSLTFILSVVFSLIIFTNLIRLTAVFNIIIILKIAFLLGALFFIWNFFFKIHTKIIITEKDITFQKIFKSKKYNFSDLECFFEKQEPTKHKIYNALFLVKENKIIERVSSFDYSNYEELKSKIKIPEYKKAEVYFYDLIKVLIGLNPKFKIKNHIE